MKKKVALNVQISKEMDEQLRSLAKEKDISKSELVRNMIDVGLNNDVETAYDSIIVDLDKRVKDVENKVKGDKGWIRKILGN